MYTEIQVLGDMETFREMFGLGGRLRSLSAFLSSVNSPRSLNELNRTREQQTQQVLVLFEYFSLECR